MKVLLFLEKLSKILFAGVATAAIGWGSLNIEWQRLGLEEDSWCFEHSDRAQDAVLRKSEQIPQILVNRYADRCGVTESEAAEVLNEDRVIAELAETAAPPAPDVAAVVRPLDSMSGPGSSSTGSATSDRDHDGFVALGAVDPTSYSRVNFDLAETGDASIKPGSPPEEGDVLEARWSVNLRSNTQLTTSGRNPIIAVVNGGDCVRVEGEPQALRGQYWAAVDLVTCPDGG